MIRLNIILPSTPSSPQWSLSLRFSHQNPVHASPLPYRRYLVAAYTLKLTLQSRRDLCIQVIDAVARKGVSLIVFVRILQTVCSGGVVILLA
jgi:hypothetical protein